MHPNPRDEASNRLCIEGNIWLDHTPTQEPNFQIETYAKIHPFAYAPEEVPALIAVIAPRYADPEQAIQHWVRRFLRTGRPTDTGRLLKTLTQAFQESFAYETRPAQDAEFSACVMGSEPLSTPSRQALASRQAHPAILP